MDNTKKKKQQTSMHHHQIKSFLRLPHKRRKNDISFAVHNNAIERSLRSTLMTKNHQGNHKRDIRTEEQQPTAYH